jgi:flagellar assembly protein FliH
MSSKILGEHDAYEPLAWPRLSGGAGLGEASMEALPIEGAEQEPMPGGSLATRDGEIEHLREEVTRLTAQIPIIAEDARNQGYQAGLRAGEAALQTARQQMAQECDDIMGRASSSIGDWAQFRVRIRRQMEHDLVRLAVAIARRILHRELQVDPDALLGIVKAAVGKLDARDLHRLVVAPQDAPVIERRLAELSLPVQVELGTDPSLPRGSLILDCSRGQMDASVDTQLEEIDRGLADVVRRTA